MQQTLGSLGEFGWLKHLEKTQERRPGILRGIGDDAAVLAWDRGKDMLFASDMLLEGRHFLIGKASYEEIGWKAMAVNISDMAAMGGCPSSAVVSLAAPANSRVEDLKKIYRGMRRASRKFQVPVVGGDTNQGPLLTISVAMTGWVEKGRALLRRGAKFGDWIFVTGNLGGSYETGKHLRFVPRVAEARYLQKKFRPSAMMDISDGLASDLRRLCEQSGAGATLQQAALPVTKGFSTLQALTDGEDFELLFTLHPDLGKKMMQCSHPKHLQKFHHIGEIGGLADGLRMVLPGGTLAPFPKGGYDHFL